MQESGLENKRQVYRAIRSLIHNRQLQPLVSERIERAEATIRSGLLVNDTTELRVGNFEVILDESNRINLNRLTVDGWRQVPLEL
jgi:hypothetical protein